MNNLKSKSKIILTLIFSLILSFSIFGGAVIFSGINNSIYAETLQTAESTESETTTETSQTDPDRDPTSTQDTTGEQPLEFWEDVENASSSNSVISNVNELVNLMKEVNNGDSKPNSTFTLACDIDLSGKIWTPIGCNYNKPFSGAFDGRGHKISGLTINASAVYQFQGLFGHVRGATIQNVILDGVNLDCTYTGNFYVGGIAGQATDSTITNCGVTGNITAESTAEFLRVGGIVGNAYWNTSISKCFSYAGIDASGAGSSSKIYIGGIAGDGNECWKSIQQCFYFGTKLQAQKGTCYIGGIVSRINNTSKIVNVYSSTDGIYAPAPFATVKGEIIDGISYYPSAPTAEDSVWIKDVSGFMHGKNAFVLRGVGNIVFDVNTKTAQQENGEISTTDSNVKYIHNVIKKEGNIPSSIKASENYNFAKVEFKPTADVKGVSLTSSLSLATVADFTANSSSLEIIISETGVTTTNYSFSKNNSDDYTVKIPGTLCNDYIINLYKRGIWQKTTINFKEYDSVTKSGWAGKVIKSNIRLLSSYNELWDLDVDVDKAAGFDYDVTDPLRSNYKINSSNSLITGSYVERTVYVPYGESYNIKFSSDSNYFDQITQIGTNNTFTGNGLLLFDKESEDKDRPYEGCYYTSDKIQTEGTNDYYFNNLQEITLDLNSSAYTSYKNLTNRNPTFINSSYTKITTPVKVLVMVGKSILDQGLGYISSNGIIKICDNTNFNNLPAIPFWANFKWTEFTIGKDKDTNPVVVITNNSTSGGEVGSVFGLCSVDWTATNNDSDSKTWYAQWEPIKEEVHFTVNGESNWENYIDKQSGYIKVNGKIIDSAETISTDTDGVTIQIKPIAGYEIKKLELKTRSISSIEIDSNTKIFNYTTLQKNSSLTIENELISWGVIDSETGVIEIKFRHLIAISDVNFIAKEKAYKVEIRSSVDSTIYSSPFILEYKNTKYDNITTSNKLLIRDYKFGSVLEFKITPQKGYSITSIAVTKIFKNDGPSITDKNMIDGMVEIDGYKFKTGTGLTSNVTGFEITVNVTRNNATFNFTLDGLDSSYLLDTDNPVTFNATLNGKESGTNGKDTGTIVLNNVETDNTIEFTLDISSNKLSFATIDDYKITVKDKSGKVYTVVGEGSEITCDEITRTGERLVLNISGLKLVQGDEIDFDITIKTRTANVTVQEVNVIRNKETTKQQKQYTLSYGTTLGMSSSENKVLVINDINQGKTYNHELSVDYSKISQIEILIIDGNSSQVIKDFNNFNFETTLDIKTQDQEINIKIKNYPKETTVHIFDAIFKNGQTTTNNIKESDIGFKISDVQYSSGESAYIDETLSLGEAPTKIGYTFKGYYVSPSDIGLTTYSLNTNTPNLTGASYTVTDPKANLYIFAIFEAKIYDLEFDFSEYSSKETDNFGNKLKVTSNITSSINWKWEYNTQISNELASSIPVLNIEGMYLFNGWNYENKIKLEYSSDKFTAKPETLNLVSEPVNQTIVFKPTEFTPKTVNYDYYDEISGQDQLLDTGSVTYGKNDYTNTLVRPNKVGYTFVGWKLKENNKIYLKYADGKWTKEVWDYASTNVNLYAVYEANKVNITFSAGSGEFYNGTKSYSGYAIFGTNEYHSDAFLATPTWVENGVSYAFAGYYTAFVNGKEYRVYGIEDERNSVFDLTGNITFVACYMINDIDIGIDIKLGASQVATREWTYDGQNRSIVITKPSSSLITYTYKWYKGDNLDTIISTEASLSVKNVKDSGKYTCVVTAQGVNDGSNFTTGEVTKTVSINVTINKRVLHFAKDGILIEPDELEVTHLVKVFDNTNRLDPSIGVFENDIVASEQSSIHMTTQYTDVNVNVGISMTTPIIYSTNADIYADNYTYDSNIVGEITPYIIEVDVFGETYKVGDDNKKVEIISKWYKLQDTTQAFLTSIDAFCSIKLFTNRNVVGIYTYDGEQNIIEVESCTISNANPNNFTYNVNGRFKIKDVDEQAFTVNIIGVCEDGGGVDLNTISSLFLEHTDDVSVAGNNTNEIIIIGTRAYFIANPQINFDVNFKNAYYWIEKVEVNGEQKNIATDNKVTYQITDVTQGSIVIKVYVTTLKIISFNYDLYGDESLEGMIISTRFALGQKIRDSIKTYGAVLPTSADVQRQGWEFIGWTLYGNSITEDTVWSYGDETLVANYKLSDIQTEQYIDSTLQSTILSQFNKEFDNNSHTIEYKITNTNEKSLNYAFSWKKGNQDLTNSTNILTVKDVKDSGEYELTVVVSAKKNGLIAKTFKYNLQVNISAHNLFATGLIISKPYDKNIKTNELKFLYSGQEVVVQGEYVGVNAGSSLNTNIDVWTIDGVLATKQSNYILDFSRTDTQKSVIAKKDVTLNIGNVQKDYDGTSLSKDGYFDDGVIKFSYKVSSNSANAGTYNQASNNINIAINGDLYSNFNFIVTGNLIINKATLNIIWEGVTEVTFDGRYHKLTPKVGTGITLLTISYTTEETVVTYDLQTEENLGVINAGVYSASFTYSQENDNYAEILNKQATLTINKRNIFITSNSNVYNRDYDGTVEVYDDLASDINVWSELNVTKIDAIVPSSMLPQFSFAFENANAGQKNIIVSLVDDTNYIVNANYNKVSASINKLNRTILVNQTKAFDAQDNFVVNVNKDNCFIETVNNEKVSGSITFLDVKNAGTYYNLNSLQKDLKLLYIGSFVYSTNYNLTFVDSISSEQKAQNKLEITKAVIIVGTNTAEKYTYTGEEVKINYAISREDAKTSVPQTLGVTYIAVGDSVLDNNKAVQVGQYTVNFILAGDDAINYEFSSRSANNVNFQIIPREIRIKFIECPQFEYTGANVEYSSENFDDVIIDESINKLGKFDTLTKWSFTTVGTDVGNYFISNDNQVTKEFVILHNGSDNYTRNYEFTYHQDSYIKITKKVINNADIELAPKEVDYNGEVQSITIKIYKNKEHTEYDEYTYNTTTPNTEISFVDMTCQNALVGNMNITSSDEVKYQGIYSFNLEMENFVLSNPDQVFEFTIKAKEVTADIINKTKTYDGTNLIDSSNINVTGVIEGDDVFVVGTYGKKDVGENIPITLNLATNTSQLVLSSYTLTATNLTGTIDKKAITLALKQNYVTYYNGNNISIDIDKFNIKGTDGEQGLVNRERFEGDITLNKTDVGTYDLSALEKASDITFNLTAITYAGAESNVSNYSFTYESLSGTVIVNQAKLSVEISDTNKIYNAKVQTPTINFYYTDGENKVKVEDSTIKVKYFTSTTEDTSKDGVSTINAGTYYILLYTEGISNFTFVDNDGTSVEQIFATSVLNIEARQIKVNIPKYVHTYNNANAVITVTNSDVIDPTTDNVGGLVSGHEFNAQLETKDKISGKYEVTNLKFSGNAEFDANYPLHPNSISIISNGETVTSNYDIVYSVCVYIIGDIESLDDKNIEKIIYKATDVTKSEDFVVKFVFNGENYTVGYGDENKIEFGNGYTASLGELQKYTTTGDNFENISEAVDVGTYKVTLKFENADNELAIPQKDITFRIVKKAITSVEGNFDKYYDGTSDVINPISSADIYEVDKEYVTINGFYTNNGTNVFAVGSYQIVFALSGTEKGDKSSNYSIDITSTGTISKQPLNLKLNSDIEVFYKGKITEIPINSFTAYTNDTDKLTNIVSKLSGNIVVKEVNAGNYTLQSLYTNSKIQTNITDVNSILQNYEIVNYTGGFKINPCQVEIVVTKDQVIYDGEEQQISYTQNVKENRGEIFDAGIIEVLYDGLNTPKVDAGTYQVTIKVKDEYANNYDICVGEELVKQFVYGNFVIAKRDIKVQIEANYQAPYTGEQVKYNVTNANILNTILADSGLVRGHNASGHFKTSGADRAVYTYGEETNFVTLHDFNIFNGENIVTQNYNVIEISGSIEIIDAVTGEIDTSHLNSLVYNAEDFVQKGEIYVFATVNGVSVKFELNNPNEWGQLTGLKDELDNPVTQVVNAGVYKVYLTINNAGDENKDREVIFTVAKKRIEQISFTKDKDYDTTADVVGEITSIDVYSIDKNDVTFVGTYVDELNSPVSKKGTHKIVFSITGAKASNYELALDAQTGTINAKEVILHLTSNYETYYTNKSVNIAKDNFVAKTADGTIVDGFIVNITGYVAVNIVETGTYNLSENQSSVDLTKIISVGNFLDNYLITGADGTLVINKAQIFVSINDLEKEYNGQYQGPTFEVAIYNACGEYTGTAEEILTVTYNKKGDSQVISNPVDAAIYNINITIADKYKSNYTLYHNGVKDEYVADETLKINKKQVRILLDTVQKFDYTGKSAVYELQNSDVLTLVSGHDVVGTLTTNGYRGGIYKLSNVDYASDFASLEITPSIKITSNGIDVSSNYEITTITAEIRIISKLGESFDTTGLQNLVYDKTDKIANGEIKVNLKVDDETREFVFGNSYEVCSFSELKYNNVGTDQVVLAGEYSFKVSVNINEAVLESEINFTVNQRTINTVSYQKDKEYDATDNLIGEITSSQIILGDDVGFDAHYAGTDVGSHTINVALVGADKDNYELSETLVLSGEITARDIELTLKDTTKLYYNASEQQIDASNLVVSAGSLVAGQKLDGHVVLLKTLADTYDFIQANLDITNLNILAAETNVISNYNITFVGKVEILPLVVEVATDGTNLIYNGEIQDIKNYLILSIDNALTSEAITAMNVAYSAQPINAGSYTATITSNSDNFIFVAGDSNIVTFEIIKRDISINIGEIKESYNPLSDYKTQFENSHFVNIVENQKVQGTFKLDSKGLDVGTYTFTSTPNYIVIESLQIIVNGIDIFGLNYNLSDEKQGSIEIIPFNLSQSSVTLKEKEIVYKADDIVKYVVVNFIDANGKTQTITNEDNTYGTIAIKEGEAINVGDYTVVVDIKNYNLENNQLGVKIIEKQIKQVIFKNDKTYDGNASVFNRGTAKKLTSTDVLLNDYSKVDVYGYYVDDAGNQVSSVGEHNIQFVILNADSYPQKNYKIAVSSKGVIEAIDVSVEINHDFKYSASGVYSLDFGEDFTVSGLDSKYIVGGNITFTKQNYLGTVDTSEIQNNLTISIAEDNNDVTSNFNITLFGAINIVKAQVEISFEGQQNTFTYNKQPASVKATSIKVVNSSDDIQDLLSVIYTSPTYSSSDAPTNVGAYRLEYTIDSPYYEIIGNNYFDFAINEYQLTIKAGDIPNDKFFKFYGEQDPELKFVLTSPLDEQISITFTRETGESIGFYDMFISSWDNANYMLSFEDGANADLFRIKKAGTLKVTILNNEHNAQILQKVYDTQNIQDVDIQTLDIEASGQIVQGTLKFAEGKDVGEYALISWNLTNENYEDFNVICELTFKITKKPVKIEAQNPNKIYDASTKFFGEIIVTDSSGAMLEGYALVAIGTYKQSGVGENIEIDVSYTGDDINNYDVQNQIYGNITKRNVEVTPLENQSITYGTTEYEIAFSAQDKETTEFYGNLTQEITGNLYISKKQGETKFIAGSYDILLNLTADNLNITLTPNVQFVINKKEVTVQNTQGFSKVYDGTKEVLGTLSLEGVLDGDNVSALGEYDSESVGRDKTITFTLTGDDANNYFAKNILGDITEKGVTLNYVYDSMPDMINKHLITSNDRTQDNLVYEQTISKSIGTLPIPSHEGYTFEGWYLDEDFTTEITNDTQITSPLWDIDEEQKTAYAKWTIEEFSLEIIVATKVNGIFVANTSGGSHNDINGLYDYYSIVDLNSLASANTGYEFIGYSTELSLSPNQDLLTYGLTIEAKENVLYAKFSPLQVEITINANGGAFIPSGNWIFDQFNANATLNVEYNSAFNNEIPLAKRYGYTQDTTILKDENGNEFSLNIDTIIGDDFYPQKTLYVVWKSDDCQLILDANNGYFAEVTEGWTVVNQDSETRATIISKIVKFGEKVGELPTPQRDGYTFASWDNGINSEYVWNTMENTPILANWTENDYQLEISSEHGSIEINIFNSDNVLLENKHVKNGTITVNVKTTNRVVLSETTDAGYTFSKWQSDFEQANNNENANLTISNFIQNYYITATYTENDNNITVVVNNKARGYVTANGQSTEDVGTFTVVLKTGASLDITAKSYEGYTVTSWDITSTFADYKYSLSGTNSSSVRTLADFVSDLVVTITFEPTLNNITLSSQHGEIIVDEASLTTHNVKIKTEQTLEFKVVADHGYVVDTNLSSWEFVTTSENKGTFNIVKNGDDVLITFTGFTADGEIIIPYLKDTFTVTLISVTKDNEYILNPQNGIVTLTQNSTTQTLNSGDSFSGEYESFVTITPNNVIEGYAFKCLSKESNKEYALSAFDGLIEQNNDGSIKFQIKDSLTIYLIYEIKQMTVKFSVNDTVRGKLSNGTHKDITFNTSVKYGYSSQIITAINEEYYQFVEWVKVVDGSNVSYSTEKQIQIDNVTEDCEFVAIFTGLPLNLTVKLVLPDEEVFEEGEIDFAAISVGANSNVNALEPTRENNQITYVISTLTGESFNFELIEKHGYEFNELVIDPRINYKKLGNEFQLIEVYLASTIEIKIKAKINVVTFNLTGKPVGANIFDSPNNSLGVTEVRYLNNNKTLNVYVKTGGNAFGIIYTFIGYKLINNEYFDAKDVTTYSLGDYNALYKGGITNVTTDQEINIEIKPYVYNVSLNVKDSETPTVVSGIIEFGDKIFNPDFDDTIKNPKIQKYIFKGYNSSENYDGITYWFDGVGLYTIKLVDGALTKVYGFRGAENLTVSQVEGVDYDCTLYAEWALETHKVELVFVPNFAVPVDIPYPTVFPNIEGRLFERNGEKITGVSYVPGSVVTIIAPLGYENFEYYGWASEPNITDRTKLNTNECTVNMEEEDIVVYLYYTIKVEVKSLGGGEVSLSNDKPLYNEQVTINATESYGYDFDCWLQNTTLVTNSTAKMDVIVTNPVTYFAKFLGKKVNIILEQSDHVKLRMADTGSLTGGEYRVGEMITFELYDLDYGYYNRAWGGEFSGSIVNNTYIITPEDLTRTYAKFKLQIEAKTINVQFVIENSVGGIFKFDSNENTNILKTYLYDKVLSFELITTQRYLLSSLTLNNKPLDLSLRELAITQQNGFTSEQTNIIKATFKQLLWIDVWEMFMGSGTENDPYIIQTEKQLAAMAYLINNNIEAQGTIPYAQGYYLVKGHMNLAERFWQPIGTKENPFDGTFNLQDYKVTDLLLDKNYEVTHMDGLFGYITENAKLITRPNNFTVAIIVISSTASLLFIVILTIVIIIILKRRRMRKLSTASTINPDTLNLDDD